MINTEEHTQAQIELLDLPHRCSYWQLFRYADKLSTTYMIVGTIAALINGCIAPLLNLLIGQLSNLVTVYDNNPTPANKIVVYNAFILRLIFLGALAAASLIFGFLQTFCWSVSAELQTKIIREKYFASVVKQDLNWFSLHPSGELTSRISSDVNQMYNGMVGLTLAGVTSWRLTLILFAVFPVPAIALGKMWQQVGINLEKVQDAYSRAGALAIQAFRSISTVMVNNGQAIEDARYSHLLEGVRRVGMRIARINGLGIGVVSFSFMAVRMPVFYYGGVLVLNGELLAGDAISTFLQISSGVMFLSNILTYLQSTNEAQTSAQKVFQIIETPPMLDISSIAGEKPDVSKGAIELRNVCFAYPSRPEQMILNEFSLKIAAGMNVALVGPSGGGKSTVFQLIMRMYDVNGGKVLYDDHDVTCLNLLWLRQQMSIVAQEPVLFDKTIAENILLGASTLEQPPTRIQVNEACLAANATEFIQKFVEGLDTRILRGTSLSGGQKQRVAIARAIIRNPSILMLDEATSALDTKSERAVQAAIDGLKGSQTTLMIAHRLSTVRNADLIVVVDGGRVVEQGSHNELMDRRGFYYSMIAAQEFVAEDRESVPADRSLCDTSMTQSSVVHSTDLLLPMDDIDEDSRTVNEVAEDQFVGERQKLSELPFPFGRVLEISRPDLKWLLVGLTGSICDGCLVPLEAYLMGTNLAVYGNPANYNGLQSVLLYSLLFFPLATLALFAKGLQQWGFGISGSNLTERLRVMTFAKLIRKDLYFYDEELHSAGALSSALSSDADAVKKITGPLAGQILTVALNIVLGFTIAFVYGYQLTLFMIACAPILFFATYLERKALEGFTEETKRAYESSGQLATSVLTNIKTVMMLSKEQVFSLEYNDSLIEPHRIGIKKSAAQGIGSGLFQALLIVVLMFAFLFSYYLILNRILEFSNIVIVVLNVILTSVAVGSIAASARNISDGKIAVNNIFKVIDAPCKINVESLYGRRDRSALSEVEFRNVRFAFPVREDVEVLKGVCFRIGQGEKVALVGSSGSGKSTIAALLQRLYDPTEGQILIDGTEIRDWQLTNYRSQIGVVGQEPILFDLTIEQNILYGHNATEILDYQIAQSERITTKKSSIVTSHPLLSYTSHELSLRVIEAAKIANIHDFIVGLPYGYSTRVGEMGSSISGGQKQRIAIARALLRNPSLLILDEATSETENLVEDALVRASTKCTTLVIAHRMKTIQNADRIYVLHDGEIIEHGSHAELMVLNGSYASMVYLRAVWFDW